MISKRRLPSIVGLVVLLSIAGATRTMAQATSDSGSAEPGRSSLRRPDGADWGGSSRVLYSMGYSDFTPWNSSFGYGTSTGRYGAGLGNEFHATPHLPSGALLTYLELDYCDTTSQVDVLLFLQDCDYRGLDCHLLGPTLSSGNGSPGCDYVADDLTAVGYITNNNLRRLVLRAITPSGTTENQIVGAYIGYKLQVSPAPAVASFPVDVPTSHPFFRFVEALAAAGITGGTGPGRFSPDSPVTRGQMAAFLSVALGLHFPN
jgi:hypothetical protein